jgi:hypothetical protein
MASLSGAFVGPFFVGVAASIVANYITRDGGAGKTWNENFKDVVGIR